MKISILTLFPEFFDGFLTNSIIKRAIAKEQVEIEIVNIRDYTLDKYGRVDSAPVGGGAGLIMKCQPIIDCLNANKPETSKVVMLSPRGKTYNQSKAKELTSYKHLIIICGHYEGFDERIYSLADECISIGNFILTGGELPSMMISDSVIRLLNGVITDTSLEYESFNDNLLDYPVYTKPRDFRGMIVPEVLVSGDHKKIDEYREEMRKKITKEYREDLM